MTAKWRDPEDPITDKEIESVEEMIGLKFPLDYIEVAKQYHGGKPDPEGFTYGDENYGGYFDQLLSFNPDDYESIQQLSFEFLTDEDVPNQVLPFGIDAAGNLLCFDYRGKETRPIVVYWLHEQNKIVYVCDTFTELLDKLYDDEDEV